MTRSHGWPTTKEIKQENRVEKRVWKFFATTTHQTAVVTSVRVAMQLVDLWDIEKAAIDSRGENPLVYHILDRDRQWLASAVATCSRSPIWSSCPHKCVGRMFTDDVTLDVAAFLARRTAQEICRKERF
jgi:hypothetical protein